VYGQIMGFFSILFSCVCLFHVYHVGKFRECSLTDVVASGLSNKRKFKEIKLLLKYNGLTLSPKQERANITVNKTVLSNLSKGHIAVFYPPRGRKNVRSRPSSDTWFLGLT